LLLRKIIRLLDKALIFKFVKTVDNQQFNSQNFIKDLGLNEVFPGKYFDMVGIEHNKFEHFKKLKSLILNISYCLDDDWKFL
jgi:hypothetical protein